MSDIKDKVRDMGEKLAELGTSEVTGDEAREVAQGIIDAVARLKGTMDDIAYYKPHIVAAFRLRGSWYANKAEELFAEFGALRWDIGYVVGVFESLVGNKSVD